MSQLSYAVDWTVTDGAVEVDKTDFSSSSTIDVHRRLSLDVPVSGATTVDVSSWTPVRHLWIEADGLLTATINGVAYTGYRMALLDTSLWSLSLANAGQVLYRGVLTDVAAIVDDDGSAVNDGNGAPYYTLTDKDQRWTYQAITGGPLELSEGAVNPSPNGVSFIVDVNGRQGLIQLGSDTSITITYSDGRDSETVNLIDPGITGPQLAQWIQNEIDDNDLICAGHVAVSWVDEVDRSDAGHLFLRSLRQGANTLNIRPYLGDVASLTALGLDQATRDGGGATLESQQIVVRPGHSDQMRGTITQVTLGDGVEVDGLSSILANTRTTVTVAVPVAAVGTQIDAADRSAATSLVLDATPDPDALFMAGGGTAQLVNGSEVLDFTYSAYDAATNTLTVEAAALSGTTDITTTATVIGSPPLPAVGDPYEIRTLGDRRKKIRVHMALAR